jgi:glycosyltransferase involved in cell wall biosynthesis
MSASDLASVILPTHNRASVLPRAVRSVLAQTHRDLELIVVDDASTDESVRVLADIDDPRLIVLRLDAHHGAAAARNRGIAAARGTYIGFQDSDDVWDAHKLKAQIEALRSAGPDVGVCVCSYRHHKGGTSRTVAHRPGVLRGERVIDVLLTEKSFGTQTLLLRRETLAAAPAFDESLPRAQDFELCLRLASTGPFVFLDDALVDIYHSEDSISADPFRFAAAIRAIVDKHPALFRAHRRGHALQLFKAGKYYALSGHYSSCVPLLLQSMRLNPWNWKSAALLLGVLSGIVPLVRKRSRELPP